MKKLMFVVLILMVSILTACSEESAKEEKESNKQPKSIETSNKEEKEPNTKKYSFEEFVKLSEQEQQDYIVPIVNELGYKDELAPKLLGFINAEDSDLPEHFKTVKDYVTYYAENSDLPDMMLEVVQKDDGYELPEGIELTEEIVIQRIEAIQGKPLFEITDSDQLTILGLSIGNSFKDVVSMFGKEDGVGKVKEGGIVYNQYIYYIPSVTEGNKYYQFIVRYGDNGETPDAITKIRLIVDNSGDTKPSLEIQEEFTNNFQGKVYFHTPIDHPFINEGATYTLNFLHNTGITQGLEILYEANDFNLTTEVWGQDQLHVWETQRSTIFDEVTMQDAEKVLRLEPIE